PGLSERRYPARAGDRRTRPIEGKSRPTRRAMTENALRVHLVRENVRVYSLGGESIVTSYGANCTAIAGRESVLPVDPLIAPLYARHIEDAVALWTPLPIRLVVLTHHHTDHALGAAYFAAKGVTVLAHAACRDRMATEHAALIESRRQRPD